MPGGRETNKQPPPTWRNLFKGRNCEATWQRAQMEVENRTDTTMELAVAVEERPVTFYEQQRDLAM